MKKIILSALLIITSTALFAQEHNDNRDRDRENRSNRDNRDKRDNRDNRDNRDSRDNRESRDNRNNRDNGNYQNQPPETVQQTWQREHQDVNNPTWERRNSQWHARYQDQRNNNRNTDIYYDQRGRQIDTHTAWERSQMPQDFDRRIRSRYHARDYQVTRIDRPNSQESLFQILLNSGNSRRTIYTDEHGNEVRYRDRH